MHVLRNAMENIAKAVDTATCISLNIVHISPCVLLFLLLGTVGFVSPTLCCDFHIES